MPYTINQGYILLYECEYIVISDIFLPPEDESVGNSWLSCYNFEKNCTKETKNDYILKVFKTLLHWKLIFC